MAYHTGRTRRVPRSGQNARLLFCALLFCAAALAKNIIPAQQKEALILGLDAGMSFQEVLDVFGAGASTREVWAELWDAGVREVFGWAKPTDDEVETADLPPHKIVPTLTTDVIPVLQPETSVDAGELPTTPAAKPAEDPPAPEPEAVVAMAYQVSDADAGLPIPDVVSREDTPLTLNYVTPVVGTLTSPFGYRDHPIDGAYKFHYGVDIAVPTGTDVVSFADGTVSFAGWGDINGNYLKITHADGFVTLYAHLDEILVDEGDTVEAGDRIARAGATGEVSGPHLHVQLYHHEKLIDQQVFLEFA